jgi:peptide/nickel transport system permease protein
VKPVRVHESLIPGLGHVLRGHARGAWRPFLYFALWLAVVVGRWHAIVGISRRLALEDVVALAFLVVFPVLLVWGTHQNLKERVFPRSRRGMGVWALAWRDFKKRPRGVWGLMLLGVVYMIAFLCPVIAPYDPAPPTADTIVTKKRAPGDTVYVLGDKRRGEIYVLGWQVEGDELVLDRAEDFATKRVKIKDLGEPKRGWTRDSDRVKTVQLGDAVVPYREEYHLLGTDVGGRDLLTRIVYGSRISLTIGLLAMVLAVGLGILFGAVAGYFGGLADGLIMRFVDILMAFPRLLLLIMIITVYEQAGIFVVVMVLGLTGWMGVARLVRAEFLRLKTLDYASAARALGLSRARIMFRHLLPNAMAPVIVSATLRVGETILVEAALSFLGLGVRPPTPTWGNIVGEGRAEIHDAWWIATLPGLAIVLTVVCFNLVGDALRDALDPRQRT